MYVLLFTLIGIFDPLLSFTNENNQKGQLFTSFISLQKVLQEPILAFHQSKPFEKNLK